MSRGKCPLRGTVHVTPVMAAMRVPEVDMGYAFPGFSFTGCAARVRMWVRPRIRRVSRIPLDGALHLYIQWIKKGVHGKGAMQMMGPMRTRLLHAKDNVMLWGWRSPGRGVLLTLGMVSLTTLLIFIGQMIGSWIGGWIGGLAAAFGMLGGGVSGLVTGAYIAESVGVSYGHRCNL